MHNIVTGGTQSNQIFATVIAKLASRFDVMNLQIF